MTKPRRNLLICVDNEGYLASLELRKIYISLADTSAAKHGYVRVIDESGEDYLFPASMFVPAVLPDDVRRAVLKIALEPEPEIAIQSRGPLRGRSRKAIPSRATRQRPAVNIRR